MRTFVVYIFLLFVVNFLFAQQDNKTQIKDKQALQILQQHGEIVIKFNVATKAEINNDLTQIMSIDYVKELSDGQGYEVRAYANMNEFQQFLTRNLPYEIVNKSSAKAVTMATTIAEMLNWDRYPTYSVYEQMLANFASTYPTLCDIDTILSPTPSGNYKILIAKISDNVNTAENEPQFLYSSSMHGDETTGYYLMLRLINYLLTNYGSITQVTNLVNGAEIWICPLANPDGTYYGSNPPGSEIVTSFGGTRRGNQANVDLNRNYPDPSAGQHPDNNSWQPETIAFMAFANEHHFNMGANFHGGAEVMNYPWDTWETSDNPNADAAWWERVCTNYVTTARTVNSSYMSSYPDGVTEGGDWYEITGGRQDYMNYFKQCREVTIELDFEKTTPTENVNNMWNLNYQSLLDYIQESLYGVRGIITDSCSGQPILAKVWVNGYDQANDSSQVYSALPVGNYHKYMIAGTYSITYSAPGYTSKTINNVVLANGQATYENVYLAPTALPVAGFTGTLNDSCSGTVQFTNTSIAASSYMWFFGDGATSTDVNPIHIYAANGTYTVKLNAFNCKGDDSLVRTDYVVIDMAVPPSVTDGYHCGPGIVELSASANGSVKWYDAATSGTLLNTGNTYTTPLLNNSTTYYVENDEVPAPVTGGMTFVASGGSGTSSGSHYLIFNADVPFTLQTVKVNNTSATTISKTIRLLNASDNVINNQQITLSIPTGPQTLTLNFSVPAGTNMRLNCTEGTNLYRHSNGVSYPYTIPSVLSITGSDAGNAYYYYFYDWQVQQTGCVSFRVPVIANIYDEPYAEFNNNIVNTTVTFTNNSTGAANYFWDFGDGNTGNETNPQHTYTDSGTYTVMLVAINGECYDTVYHDVSIALSGIAENCLSQLLVLPNPASDFVILDFGQPINIPVEINMYDVSGQLMYQEKMNTIEKTHDINISALADGLYILMVNTPEQTKYFRVSKIH
ncbi:MAG: PKD domain-containing protein [Bacteroidales bacterium]|jgi:PKD repeat protein|nr:PKD domain-containing protein [Bacteroidales bacterium]